MPNIHTPGEIIILCLGVLFFICMDWLLIRGFKRQLTPANKCSATNIKEQNREPENSLFQMTPSTQPLLSKIAINTSEAFSFSIPQDVLSLLWIKNGPLQNCTQQEMDEPSAIDISAPIDLTPDKSDFISDIGYYPSYSKLSPKQRTVYLGWLQNIRDPIPIGYVFIFYYGLERFLFTEKYELAFQMMENLRKYHENGSLFAYSADAMIVCCFLHNRLDLIKRIDLDKTSQELFLYIKGYLAGGLSARELMETCRRWNFTNTRYIKKYPDLFEAELKSVLSERFDAPLFPLTHADYMRAKQTFQIVLANPSLPYDTRLSAAKDITSNITVAQDVLNLLQTAHNRLKRNLSDERKQQK